MFQQLRMILACKKNLVNKHKQVGLGQTPPQYGKYSHLIPFFLLKTSLRSQVSWVTRQCCESFDCQWGRTKGQGHLLSWSKQLKMNSFLKFLLVFLIESKRLILIPFKERLQKKTELSGNFSHTDRKEFSFLNVCEEKEKF